MTEATHSVQGKMGETSRLAKGDEVSLSAIDPGLHKLTIAAGWQAPDKKGDYPVDIDLSAFLLRLDGKVRRDIDFVFYNNPEGERGALKHKGELMGANGGDQEGFDIDLEAVGFDVERVAFVMSLHNADERVQTLALVKDAYIRLVNTDTGAELVRYTLAPYTGEAIVLLMAELVRDGMGWKFIAVGEEKPGGLYKVARDYDVNVAAS